MGNILTRERIYSPCCDSVEKLYNKVYFSNRKLEIKEIEKGVILPTRRCKDPVTEAEGGVCDENLNFVAGLVPLKCTKAYSVKEEEIKYIDETVLYGGMLWEHPGHLLRDALPSRLWWVIKNPDSDIRIAINTISGSGDCKGHVQEALELLDICEDRVIFIDQPTRFRSIIVPDQSLYVMKDYTEEYVSVLDKMMSNVEPGPYEKVYFNKGQTKKNDFTGDEYFEDFFRNRGFEIIIPETYSFKEKLSILKGAKEYASISGTNTVYAACCNPDVKMIVLERLDENVNATPFIVQARGIKDFYSVNVCLSFLTKSYPFGAKLVGVTDSWIKFVKNYYGEEVKISTKDYFKDHVYDYLEKFVDLCVKSENFERFKNVDHFYILNILNRLIHGSELNRESFKLESLGQYRNQVKAFKEQLSHISETNMMQAEVYKDLFSKAINKLDSSFTNSINDRNQLMKYLVKPRLSVVTKPAVGKWSRQVNDEEICGAENSKSPIVSIKIQSNIEGTHIYYSVFRKEGLGWSVDVADGNVCGSVKNAIPINALRMRLDDEMSKYFTIQYRAYTQPKGWTAWVADGTATSYSNCDMIDAIQVRIDYREDFAEKWEALANKFLQNLDISLEKGREGYMENESEKYKVQMEALQNQVQAQEYIIKNLQETLAIVVNDRRTGV